MIKSNKITSRTNFQLWLRNIGRRKRERKWIREEREQRRYLQTKKYRKTFRTWEKYSKWRERMTRKMNKKEFKMKHWRNKNLIWEMKDWHRARTANFNLKSMRISLLTTATHRRITCSLEKFLMDTQTWLHPWRAMLIFQIDKEIRLSLKHSSFRLTIN